MNRKKGFLMFLMIGFFLLWFVPSSFSATVDVMIVYDLTAKSWVDSHAGMSTFASNAVARMNQALANSGVTNLTFRLVSASQISYTYATGDEGASLGAALSFLRTSIAVRTLRNTCGADVVVMLVDTGSAYGTVGLGYELSNPGGSPNYAFSVSAIRSVYDSETMTHEVGHNFGCGHSKDQADYAGPGIFSYSAGWYFSDYSSIMAYNDPDGDGKADHIEASYFSNPDVTVDGEATGDTADGDNARTLEETAAVVEGYRTSTSSTSTTITTTTTTTTTTSSSSSSSSSSTSTSTSTTSVTTEAESTGSNSSGGGGGCFIATAAFGSPMAGQVEILRQFRDRYLLTNAWGKKFVAWYYRNGPEAASYIKDKPLVRAAVRGALYPLIGFSTMLISGYLPLVMFGLLLSMLLYLRFRPQKPITR